MGLIKSRVTQNNVMTNQTRRNFVLFLGAGFSVDAELPTMAQFGKGSRVDYDTLRGHAARGEKYAAPMLVEAAEVFYAFQGLCRSSTVLSESDCDNLETVFSIAEAMSEAGVATIPLAGQDISLNALMEKIQLWLWKIYQQCALRNPQRRTRAQTYNDFFDILRKSGVWGRSTVITTNYDLIFEYMAWNNGLACNYPFRTADDIEEVNIGTGSQLFISSTQDRVSNESVCICKLHGSVNYFEDIAQAGSAKLHVSANIGDKQPIGKSYNFHDAPAVFAVDAIWQIREDYKQSFTPAIVPPTYSKLGRKAWLTAIWRHAFQALKEADSILFIGYSLPETDGFMRALVHAALAMRQTDSPLQVFVIDPSEVAHHRFKLLFKSSYQETAPCELQRALNTGSLEAILGTIAACE